MSKRGSAPGLREEAERKWATTTIRTVMVKNGLSYADLVERLSLLGIEENERNLRNKVARGTFSAAFMAECLAALGVEVLEIDISKNLCEPHERVAFELTLDRLNAGLPIDEAKISADQIDDGLIRDLERSRHLKSGRQWRASQTLDRGQREAGIGLRTDDEDDCEIDPSKDEA